MYQPNAHLPVMPETVTHLAVVSRVAGAASTGVGCLVVWGWAFDIETLKHVVPGLVAMNPMTAVAFILTGIALLLLRIDQPHPALQRIAQLLAVTIAVIGLSKLVAIVFAFDAGIDQFLFRTKLGAPAGGFPNRMAPNTALNFVLAGAALLLLDRPTRGGRWPAQWLVFIAGTLTILPLMGYAYGITSFYGMDSFIPMAMHTAVTFLIIEMGILAALPRCGFMTMFTSDTSGGIIARRLLPMAILVPIGLGWLRLAGQRAGFYTTEAGTALVTMANIIIFTLIITGIANRLYRADAELRETERALRMAKDAAEAANRAKTRANDDLASSLRRLDARTKALEAKTREQETFVHTVAHDLKAPLVSLQGMAALMAEDYGAVLDEGGHMYLERIAANARKMHLLLDDLLELARVGHGEVELTPVNLAEVVDAVVEQLRHTLTARGAEVVCEGALPIVFANPSRMAQVFTNLIDNAVKYTPADRQPRVCIEAVEQQESWEIVVQDNGVGIPQAAHDKVFDLFQRLPSGKTLHPSGTGVGLAIVARIIELHDGKLWLESKVGVGTTFHFTVPKAEAAAHEQQLPLPKLAAPPERRVEALVASHEGYVQGVPAHGV